MKVIYWTCSLAFLLFIHISDASAQELPTDGLDPGSPRIRLEGYVYDCQGRPWHNTYVAIYGKHVEDGHTVWVVRDETDTDETGRWRTASWQNFSEFAVVVGKDTRRYMYLPYYTRHSAAPQFTDVHGRAVDCSTVNCNFTELVLPEGPHGRQHYYVKMTDDKIREYFVSGYEYFTGFNFIQADCGVPPPSPQPTPSARPPSCSITRIGGPSGTVPVGSSVEYAVTGQDLDGNLRQLELWQGPLPSPNGQWQQLLPQLTQAPFTATANFTCSPDKAGRSYYVVCNAYDYTGIQCTGNPLNEYPNYYSDCGPQARTVVSCGPLPTPRPTLTPSPSFTPANLKNTLHGYGYVDNYDGKVNMLDAVWVWGRI